MNVQQPKGTHDVLPPDSARWQELERRVREVMAACGFQEVRTPHFESRELYIRSVGETTDIVEKEMYTFGGENHDEFALRPEQTAGVVRAYLQHNFAKSAPRQKWFYIGPNFRHERPQKGRFRQHHQIGIENFGSKSPKADAENIALLAQLYNSLGITKFNLLLNTLGDRECRPKYRAALQEFLSPLRDKLCAQCQARFERNIFRVLDCKNESCRALTANVPPIDGYLNEECRRDFDELRDLLSRLDIPFAVDPRLVRGLDYYSKAVFEFQSDDLGAQATIGGGGRYDALITDLGGPDVGAAGFGTGIERILLVQEAQSPGRLDRTDKPDLWFIIIPDDNRAAMEAWCFERMVELRRLGLSSDMDLDGRSVKSQMRTADKAGARFAAIVGPDEFSAGQVKLKSFADGVEMMVPAAGIAQALQK